MKESGFSLVEAMVSLLLTLIIAMGVGHLFLAGARVLRKMEEFQERSAPFLLASRIGDDVSRAVYLKDDFYYRAVGVGFSQDGVCRLLMGRRTSLVFYENKISGQCPSWGMVLFLRRKRVFLRGDTLYMKVGNRSQPMASGIISFSLERRGDEVKVRVNGEEVIRRLK